MPRQQAVTISAFATTMTHNSSQPETPESPAADTHNGEAEAIAAEASQPAESVTPEEADLADASDTADALATASEAAATAEESSVRVVTVTPSGTRQPSPASANVVRSTSLTLSI